MRDMRNLMNFCIQILNIEMSLLGFDVTLWQVFLYGGVGFIILYFTFRMAK